MQTEELSVPGLGMRVSTLCAGCFLGLLSSQGLAEGREEDEQASQGGLSLAA